MEDYYCKEENKDTLFHRSAVNFLDNKKGYPYTDWADISIEYFKKKWEKDMLKQNKDKRKKTMREKLQEIADIMYVEIEVLIENLREILHEMDTKIHSIDMKNQIVNLRNGKILKFEEII